MAKCRIPDTVKWQTSAMSATKPKVGSSQLIAVRDFKHEIPVRPFGSVENAAWVFCPLPATIEVEGVRACSNGREAKKAHFPLQQCRYLVLWVLLILVSLPGWHMWIVCIVAWRFVFRGQLTQEIEEPASFPASRARRAS